MKYYMIAGEASGDKHGAALMRALKSQDPYARFRFWGGDAMISAAAQQPVTHIRDMAFMGFVEVIRHLSIIISFFRKAKEDISLYRPDVVIFVDYPGFNLRMAKWAKKQGFKVVYYISPTIWAWHQSRVYDVKKYVDQMYCILPFEVAFYKKFGVIAYYHGNPVADEVNQFIADPDFKAKWNIVKPILAILPGSRIQEIQRILPGMMEGVQPLEEKYQLVIAKADNLDVSVYNVRIPPTMRDRVIIIPGAYYDILAHARIAVVTSGTATLETALFNVPQVVCYKAGPLTFALAKWLVNLPFISLVNLISGKPLVVELIQHKCNAGEITAELRKLDEMNDQERNGLYDDLHSQLGPGNTTQGIARDIFKFLSP